MSEKKHFDNHAVWESTGGEIRKGAIKYVESLTNVLEKCEEKSPFGVVKEIVMMGYATGVVAGKLSDSGIEGFTLLLNGIKISMHCEQRKEAMQFAIWDKDGRLHTSEEGFQIKEGGQE